MISLLMVSSKNVKVSQKRCLRTSIESFAGSSLSEQIFKFSTIMNLKLQAKLAFSHLQRTENRALKVNFDFCAAV